MLVFFKGHAAFLAEAGVFVHQLLLSWRLACLVLLRAVVLLFALVGFFNAAAKIICSAPWRLVLSGCQSMAIFRRSSGMVFFLAGRFVVPLVLFPGGGYMKGFRYSQFADNRPHQVIPLKRLF